MFRNYLTTALRTIWKNKLSSIINILGLSLGIACSILIFLFIEHELSFDDFHVKKDRIYRICEEYIHATGVDRYGSTPYPLAPRLRLDFPDLQFSRIVHLSEIDLQIEEDKVINEYNLLWVDTVFFDLFDYQWISGSPETSLKEPNSIVLTENLVEKYFNEKDPIGKIIRIDNTLDCIVTGIIENPPSNTHLPFNLIIPVDALSQQLFGANYDSFTTTLTGFATYALLPKGYTPETFETQVKETLVDIYDEETAGNMNYRLEPLNEIHLDSQYSNVDSSYVTERRHIYIYTLVGLFILIIASINFINLATAQALKRSREVGIRKVIGAFRKQLISQFLTETFLTVLLAMIFALILAELFVTKLNDFLGYGIKLSVYNSSGIFFFLTVILIIITLVSGVYPSFIISRFKPVQAIQHNLTSSTKTRHRLLIPRSILVILQFIISLILIISTFIIASQMSYFKNTSLGYDKDDILIVQIPDNNITNIKAIRTKIENNPHLLNYTIALDAPTAYYNMDTYFSPDDASQKEFLVSIKPVDTSYLRTFGLELLAGEWVPFKTEEDTIYDYVVNEKVLSMLGIHDPYEALGRRLQVGRYEGTIHGVVRDFHNQSLSLPIEPVIFVYSPRYFYNVLIKSYPGKIEDNIQYLEKTWSEIFPGFTFNYEILENRLLDQYDSETRTYTVIRIFAFLAIIIACLGLFGLVSYLVVNRTKEIGIRKVLGARIVEIIELIARDFFLLIIIANLIAAPLAWIFMNRWLEQFSYRVSIHWWIFLITALISLMIAFITILYQALVAAYTNPVEAIKYE